MMRTGRDSNYFEHVNKNWTHPQNERAHASCELISRIIDQIQNDRHEEQDPASHSRSHKNHGDTVGLEKATEGERDGHDNARQPKPPECSNKFHFSFSWIGTVIDIIISHYFSDVNTVRRVWDEVRTIILRPPQ